MKNYTLILIGCLTMLFSCKNDSSTDKVAAPAPVEQERPNPNTADRQGEMDANGNEYQSITADIMQNLYNNCQFIDYIFNDLPFSMNQSESNGIKGTISHVTTIAQPTIPADCKPIARQLFQIDGEIVLEADVYFSENCQFFVFFEGRKPIYANKMSASGIEFYTNIIKQAMQARQSATNG